MAVQQTAETGHDITLATHLVKNFDGYGEELLHEMETGEEMQ